MKWRKKTRKITVGDVVIGGNDPVSIQSMVKLPTSDVAAVVRQVKELERCGCEIIRVAVRNMDDAAAIKKIKQKIKIPLVADIHFNYKLALKAIEMGVDKIRLNPGNIKNDNEIRAVVKAVRKRRIPIRVGVNSGSVEKSLVVSRQSSVKDEAGALVKSALNYVKNIEGMGFRDIIISLKASDVKATVEAYRKMAALCDYPFHLGVTAAGPMESGIVKSAIGIGALLLDGIGDTIRVSLTADPVEEVLAAKRILSAAGTRSFGPEIISCPTCGRCQVDLGTIVRTIENRVRGPGAGVQGLKIAIMGCEVNGPGEAKEADIGIAFGKASGILFKKGKIFKKVNVKDAVNELLKII